MTPEVQEDLDNTDVSLVDANVQWRLAPLVTSVEVGTAALQHSYHLRFVAKRCVMHCAVTILVLHKTYALKYKYSVTHVLLTQKKTQFNISKINYTN